MLGGYVHNEWVPSVRVDPENRSFLADDEVIWVAFKATHLAIYLKFHCSHAQVRGNACLWSQDCDFALSERGQCPRRGS